MPSNSFKPPPRGATQFGRKASMMKIQGTCLLILVLVSCSSISSKPDPSLRERLVKMFDADQKAMHGVEDKDRILHENTTALKRIVRERGWPTISQVGEDGAQAAWMIAQHSDFDRDFQRQAIEMMTRLAPRREVDLSNLAYLEDRILHADGKGQKFGTQGQCTDGRFVPFALQDADQVDERRRSMEMKPLSEYVSQASRVMCSRH